MPVHNGVCNNRKCAKWGNVLEVILLRVSSPMPACTECGDPLSKTFALTERDKSKVAQEAKKNKKVRDPFLKPNTVLRRAFKKGSTGADLADDLRTGDIYL